MPSLRFARDKRGYETTSLVHVSRRNGRSRQRILYWFRTPPGIKVGRPALDAAAIRAIEEQNPDIEFDWPKILEAQPAAQPADDSRARRPRRDRDRPRPPRAAAPPATSPQQDRPKPPSEPSEPELELSEPEQLEPEPLELEPLEPSEPELEPEPELERSDPTPGREQFARLRARYAELLARITERGGDPERVDALRAEADKLNPDTWVTSDEVREGLESFEPKIRDLRAALGLRRRRRSRRGGRRRSGEPQGTVPAAEPESSEN